MFIKVSDLQARVMITAKDANESERISWVTLDPVYHSKLVRTAIAAAKANGLKHSIASIKEALFTFLLDILNGKPQKGFFTKLEPKRDNRRGSTRDHTHPTRPARKGSQTSNHNDEQGNAPPLPPSPPPPPLPPRTRKLGSEPPNGLQLTAAEDNAVKPPLKVPPTAAPPQAHPCLPTSQVHDTYIEDAEEFLIQLENSMQDKTECEALLLMDVGDLSTLMNSKPNSSKQDPPHQRKASNTAPAPAPTHPKTRQASKGRLKK